MSDYYIVLHIHPDDGWWDKKESFIGLIGYKWMPTTNHKDGFQSGRLLCSKYGKEAVLTFFKVKISRIEGEIDV